MYGHTNRPRNREAAHRHFEEDGSYRNLEKLQDSGEPLAGAIGPPEIGTPIRMFVDNVDPDRIDKDACTMRIFRRLQIVVELIALSSINQIILLSSLHRLISGRQLDSRRSPCFCCQHVRQTTA
jgi:hypothetical protein